MTPGAGPLPPFACADARREGAHRLLV